MPDRKPTIEELCRPLSARVMPRRALYSISGREMEPGRAMASQRHRGGSKAKLQKKGRPE